MNPWLWILPFGLQGLAMGVDEFGYHRRRSVPGWEASGHVLDTLAFLACLTLPALLGPSPGHLRLFAGMAAGSCLLITKDEFLHQRLCSAGEHWLHALLFILHPIVLIATGWSWFTLGGPALARDPGLGSPWAAGLLLQVVLVTGFLLVQSARGLRQWRRAGPARIDNDCYEELGDRWYAATDHPVALLRAESRLRTGWLLEDLAWRFGKRPLAILDVACGAGFLANPLARAGHDVTGIDLSPGSLEVARRQDRSGRAQFLTMDARHLNFSEGRFEVVCMMDFLEHLAERDAVIGAAARVLKPGGCLYFHTFNRTPLSWLVAIQGVRWLVRNAPRHLHVYDLFLTPTELEAICARHGLVVEDLRGVRPCLFSRAFLRLLVSGRVSDEFQFRFARSLSIGYCGRARKRA